jgi:Mg-chelatase subunit ChlD
VKGRLQAAIDGAALGAARALNLGETLQAQQTTAAQNAVNWFYANFPPNTWATTGTVMSSGSMTENDGSGYYSQSVNIYPDMSNPQLDHVDLTASTKVPTWFMHWFGLTSTTLNVKSSATRRAAVVMMVLDRSGSMCAVNGVAGNQPCGKSSTGSACAAMINAAKEFTGSFAEGRDYMGMVTFSSDAYVVPNSGKTIGVPDQSFQATLGYTSTSGTGTGYLDNLQCAGGTNTAQAIALGYQLLVQTALPGALNILLIETDGLPNTMTMNMWDSTHSISMLTDGSNSSNISPCTDNTPATKTSSGHLTAKNGGFTAATYIPNWTNYALNLTSAPFGSTNPNLYPNVPQGMITTVYTADPNTSGTGTDFNLGFYQWSNPAAQTPQMTAPSITGGSGGTAYDSGQYNTNYYMTGATNCTFNSVAVTKGSGRSAVTYPAGIYSGESTNPPTDFAYYPMTDVFGSQVNPTNAYKSVNTTNDRKGVARLKNTWKDFHNGALNATDNAAYNARANTTYPAYIFAVGLGNNSAGAPPDPVLMQRIANDPDGDTFNSPAQYPACATETGCLTYDPKTTGQLQGTYVFAPTSNQLAQAFLQISSQILRLNK